jgi:hypothetical protein
MDESKPHGAAGHEQSEVDARAISEFGIGLGLGVIAAAFLMWFVFDQFASSDNAHQTPPAPMEAANPQKTPPEPRLEAQPRMDLSKFRASEEERVNSYGWIDPAKGIVRIPISRAMDLVAKEGLK